MKTLTSHAKMLLFINSLLTSKLLNTGENPILTGIRNVTVYIKDANGLNLLH